MRSFSIQKCVIMQVSLIPTHDQTNLLAERWGMQRCLEPHLVRDDWLRLLHADWLVEQGALVQGELGVGVQRWADLERSWGRGTHAGW